MKKSIQLIIITILLLACSGCFPVLVPADGERERGGGGHDRHDQGERGGRRN